MFLIVPEMVAACRGTTNSKSSLETRVTYSAVWAVGAMFAGERSEQGLITDGEVEEKGHYNIKE